MKKFINEFKEFALKGNAVDMAIGIIIGAGFNSIVNSLVQDVFSPIFGLLLSDVNFSDLKITLKSVGDNVITLNYGSFIQNIINFIIVAFVTFLIVKAMNKAKERHKKEEVKKETLPSAELQELQKIREILEANTNKK